MAFHVKKATKIIPHFRNNMSLMGFDSTHLRKTPFDDIKIGIRVLGFECMLTHLSARRFGSIKVEKRLDSVNGDRDNQVEYNLMRSTLIPSSDLRFHILYFYNPKFVLDCCCCFHGLRCLLICNLYLSIVFLRRLLVNDYYFSQIDESLVDNVALDFELSFSFSFCLSTPTPSLFVINDWLFSAKASPVIGLIPHPAIICCTQKMTWGFYLLSSLLPPNHSSFSSLLSC